MLEQVIEELRAELALVQGKCGELLAENVKLRAWIEELLIQTGKNSGNSSKPPSTDAFVKRTRSQRKREGRSVGKQKGTPGHHLEQVEDPDEVIRHEPSSCRSCGGALTGKMDVDEVTRQQFDLPTVRAHVTEHRATRRECRGCGVITTGEFPAEVQAPAVYGPRVKALVVYGHVYQHIPYVRLRELVRDLTGMTVSTGAMEGMVRAASAGADHFADVVREELTRAAAVHLDETGARVEKHLRWIHSASTSRLTLQECHEKRGAVAIDAMNVLAGMQGVAVHDCWKPYFGYRVEHGLCNAHLLRELDGVHEGEGQEWATTMMGVLCDAKTAVEAARLKGRVSLSRKVQRRIDGQYVAAIHAGHDANPLPTEGPRTGYCKVAHNLVTRMEERREEVMRFTTNFEVPFDNNQAERDIRMVKLQQKISGCWRTLGGAQRYCRIRSYVSTLRKNGQNPLEGLELLVRGTPWLPART